MSQDDALSEGWREQVHAALRDPKLTAPFYLHIHDDIEIEMKRRRNVTASTWQTALASLFTSPVIDPTNIADDSASAVPKARDTQNRDDEFRRYITDLPAWFEILQNLLDQHGTGPYSKPVNVLVSEMRSSRVSTLLVTFTDDETFANSLKCNVEALINSSVNWWPLPPTRPRLSKDQVLLTWSCVCGQLRYLVVPVAVFRAVLDIMAACKIVANERGTPFILQSSHHEIADSAPDDSSIAQTASTQTPYQSSSSPDTKNLFVFVVVNGWGGFKFIQWKVDGNDNQFFDRLKKEYTRSRGWLRWGWYRYSHCEFYEIEKADLNSFYPRKAGFPDSTDSKYRYAPLPMKPLPPITPHTFYKKFNSCRDASAWHKLLPWHHCYPQYGGTQAVDLLPKHIEALELHGDKREVVYGLYACESVSAIVAVLFIAPGLIYFAVSSWRKPGNLGDASVPLQICLALMLGSFSLEWLFRPRRT